MHLITLLRASTVREFTVIEYTYILSFYGLFYGVLNKFSSYAWSQNNENLFESELLSELFHLNWSKRINI